MHGMSEMCHVWTAPGWQVKLHVAPLVGAAMCSAPCGVNEIALDIRRDVKVGRAKRRIDLLLSI